jgi:hypothetical protein
MENPSELNDPSWPDILRAVQTQVQARIHTTLPGRVRSYDVAPQTAEVELVVQLDGEAVPPLAEVPVLWPGGAAGFLHVPLAEGDTVMVLFAEEDFSRWFETGSVSAPAALARHGLHAVAIPGLRRAAAPLAVTTGHVTLAATSALHLGSDTATAAVALNPAVAANYTQLKTALDGVVAKLNTLDPTATAAWNAAMAGWPVSAAATKVKAV